MEKGPCFVSPLFACHFRLQSSRFQRQWRDNSKLNSIHKAESQPSRSFTRVKQKHVCTQAATPGFCCLGGPKIQGVWRVPRPSRLWMAVGLSTKSLDLDEYHRYRRSTLGRGVGSGRQDPLPAAVHVGPYVLQLQSFASQNKNEMCFVNMLHFKCRCRQHSHVRIYTSLLLPSTLYVTVKIKNDRTMIDRRLRADCGCYCGSKRASRCA